MRRTRLPQTGPARRSEAFSAWIFLRLREQVAVTPTYNEARADRVDAIGESPMVHQPIGVTLHAVGHIGEAVVAAGCAQPRQVGLREALVLADQRLGARDVV